MDPAEPVCDVLIVEIVDVSEVVSETLTARVGQQGGSIFLTFAVSDGDVTQIKIDILNTEPQALEDSHSGAVEQQNDELSGAFEAGE